MSTNLCVLLVGLQVLLPLEFTGCLLKDHVLDPGQINRRLLASVDFLDHPPEHLNFFLPGPEHLSVLLLHLMLFMNALRLPSLFFSFHSEIIVH